MVLAGMGVWVDVGIAVEVTSIVGEGGKASVEDGSAVFDASTREGGMVWAPLVSVWDGGRLDLSVLAQETINTQRSISNHFFFMGIFHLFFTGVSGD